MSVIERFFTQVEMMSFNYFILKVSHLFAM
jgi:hypothetical protein